MKLNTILTFAGIRKLGTRNGKPQQTYSEVSSMDSHVLPKDSSGTSFGTSTKVTSDFFFLIMGALVDP